MFPHGSQGRRGDRLPPEAGGLLEAQDGHFDVSDLPGERIQIGVILYRCRDFNESLWRTNAGQRAPPVADASPG